jgi:hypothetical protein
MATHLEGFWKALVGMVLVAAVVVMFAPLAARAQCVRNTNDSGTGSLRACVATANAASSSTTITFASNLDGQTITLTSGPLTISNTSYSVTITGPGANLLTISGGNAVQVFSIATGATVSTSGLTIANGSASSDECDSGTTPGVPHQW